MAATDSSTKPTAGKCSVIRLDIFFEKDRISRFELPAEAHADLIFDRKQEMLPSVVHDLDDDLYPDPAVSLLRSY